MKSSVVEALCSDRDTNGTTSSPKRPQKAKDDDQAAIALTRPPRQSLISRANCTHVVMDFFHTTTVPCDHCGHPPALGWLYICRQDGHAEALARRQMNRLDGIHIQEPVPTRLDELKACGLSDSVLDQIKQGNVYDPFQIEILKNQKLHLLRVMDDQLSHERQALENLAGTSEDSLDGATAMSDGAKAALATTSKLVEKLGHFERRSRVIPQCNFKCCQACRPYLRDRAFVPLEAAIRGSIDPERFVVQEPFIAAVEHVENLGLRTAHQRRNYATHEDTDEQSDSSSMCSDDDMDDSDDEVNSDTLPSSPESPDTRSYIESLRHRYMSPSLHEATPSRWSERESRTVVDRSENKLPGGLLQRVTRGLTPQWIFHSKSHVALSAPDSSSSTLRRVNSHHIVSRVGEQEQDSKSANPETARNKTFITPRSSTHMLPCLGLNHQHACSTRPPSPRSAQSNACSALSDEVIVDGGVALTEEAVSNQLPDIITQV